MCEQCRKADVLASEIAASLNKAQNDGLEANSMAMALARMSAAHISVSAKMFGLSKERALESVTAFTETMTELVENSFAGADAPQTGLMN